MSSDFVYTNNSKITDIDPNALRTLTLKWLTDFPRISSIPSPPSTGRQAGADQETSPFMNLRKLTINATEFDLSERFQFTQEFFPSLEELVLLQPEFPANGDDGKPDGSRSNELEINLPRLKSLYLYKCHGLKRVRLVSCKMLESAKFHVNKELQEIADCRGEPESPSDSPSDSHLRLISLDKCANLQRFGIRKVEHVRVLKIDGCARLESFANASFPSLEDCVLQGSSISAFGLAAPALRTLQLAGSRNLAEISVDDAKYPKLEFLDVSRSPELTSVRAAGKLGRLRAVWSTGCAKAEVVDLGGLQQQEARASLELVVDDCSNLKQVVLPRSSQSPTLRKLSLRNCGSLQPGRSQLTVAELSQLEWLSCEHSAYDTFSFARELVLNKYANVALVCCGLGYLARSSHRKVDVREFEAAMQMVDGVGRLLTEKNEKGAEQGADAAAQQLVRAVAHVYCETAAELVLRLNLIAMMADVGVADSHGRRTAVGRAMDSLAGDGDGDGDGDNHHQQCGPRVRQQARALRDKLDSVRNRSFSPPDARQSSTVTGTVTAVSLLREHKRASSVLVSSRALRIMNEPDNNRACPICLQDYATGTSDSGGSGGATAAAGAWYYCNCGHSICGECSDLYNSGRCYYCCQPTGKLVPRGAVSSFMEEVVRGDYGRWDALYRALCAIAS